MAWLTADIKNTFEILVLTLMEQILLGNSASPLRKALIDSGLGSALCDGAGYDSDNRDTMFVSGLKDVEQSAAEKVKKIIAEGNLSTFKQETDDGRLINAEAKKMVYSITGNKIVLTKDAKLTEAGNTFASDSITFFTDKEIVKAGSTSGNDRVNITVFPETVNDKNEE